MEIHFSKLKYQYFDRNLIEIAFLLSDKDKCLIYKNKEFKIENILNFSDEWEEYVISGCITSIRLNEDFEHIIKLKNNTYIKICFSGCNYTIDGIIESFHVIDDKSMSFKSIEEDFNDSEEVEILNL